MTGSQVIWYDYGDEQLDIWYDITFRKEAT